MLAGSPLARTNATADFSHRFWLEIGPFSAVHMRPRLSGSGARGLFRKLLLSHLQSVNQKQPHGSLQLLTRFGTSITGTCRTTPASEGFFDTSANRLYFAARCAQVWACPLAIRWSRTVRIEPQRAGYGYGACSAL
jgi:hypothetical protein